MDVLRRGLSMALRRVGGKDDGGVDFVGWWWLPHEGPPPSGHSSASSSLSSPLSSSGDGDGSASPLLRRRRIRVVGQCKAEKKKIGPNYIRELEGVLYRFLTHPPNPESDPHTTYPCFLAEDDDVVVDPHDVSQPQPPPTIAVLVSQSAFTKSTVLRANSSPIPFCLLHLPLPSPPPTTTTTAGETEAEHGGEEPPLSCEEQQQQQSAGSLGSMWCNPALCGAKGLLRGRMEVRWERDLESARPALWWDGSRLPSWVPDLG